MKKVATLVLSIIMVMSLVPLGAFAQNTEKTGEAVTDAVSVTYTNPLYSDAVYGLDVTARTQDEIRQFMVANPIDLNWLSADTYAKAPSLEEPYAPGVLSDYSFNNAINAVNQMRFIAGLNADVVLDDSYSEMISAGSLLNCLNNTLTHFPERPAQLTASKYDQLYELGYDGTSSSNIAWGYDNIACSVVYGYMYDGDSTNIDRVGHRRWVLNPPMKKTGFGRAGEFSGMYAFDRSGSGRQRFVAWPAQITHTDYFSYMDPWSLTISTPIYTASVKMVRRSDGAVWEFSPDYSGDGYFNIENSYYGQPGCIIWRPETIDDIIDGDVFDVSVNVRTLYDEFFDICYTVSFMDCLNGFMKNSSGGGAYYTNGVVDTSASGLVKYDGRYHYIKKGVWQNNFTGLLKYNGEWIYLNKGVVDEHYTGM
ncbi:MAG: hypothetical protein IIV99_03145, partial [Oscillospiraceae bacterium]|nr:hypothetical protein [Oscillospiraceae bacterium]